MDKLKTLLGTGIGRKLLMAVTGLAMIGFLISHVAANITVLFAPDAYHHYSHALISNPLIYIAEAGLVALFVSHFISGFSLTRKNREARSRPYAATASGGDPSRRSLASQTMILTGLVMLIFVPLHIKTFKFGPWYTVAGDPEVRDLARLVFEVFQSPLYVVWYVVAIALLGFHAWHGFGSAFESLGVDHRPALRRTGNGLAAALTAGFLIIPIWIYLMGVPQ